jgi:hypothetical protein
MKCTLIYTYIAMLLFIMILSKVSLILTIGLNVFGNEIFRVAHEVATEILLLAKRFSTDKN